MNLQGKQMNKATKELVDQLADVLNAKAINWDNFEKRSGVSDATVFRFKRNPSGFTALDTVVRMAEACGHCLVIKKRKKRRVPRQTRRR